MRLISKLLFFGGVFLLFFIFSRPVFYEMKYWSEKMAGTHYELTVDNGVEELSEKVVKIVPVDEDFGIVIPKIGANAKIFPEIDPLSPQEFLPILKQGVAHAKGTAFPGQGEKIYLFAHSADAFYNVGRYNAVFYLIGKLEKGDEIDIYYNRYLYKYKVEEKKVVSPNAVDYLSPSGEEILILQTCYPPGTTLRRLIVTAKPL